jgi:phage protein D
MTDLFGATAPVFKVGSEARGELARDLSRLEIDEATDGLRTLTLRLVAQGPRDNAEEEEQLYLDGQVVDLGKELEVSIGPSDGARIVFKGLISGLEATFTEGGEPHVVLYAEDQLMKMRMTRRMKTYENKTDADIAKMIADEHQIGAEATADGPKYKVVQQWNQSDLAFLRERARLVQAEVWLQDDKLHFQSRNQRHGTPITLIQGNDLIDVQLRADLAHQRTSVKVSGYDVKARDTIEAEATADAIQSEISGGRTGPSILKTAFKERTSYRVRENPLVTGEATAWAKAEMLRRCRGFVTVAGTTTGSPDMVVGSRLTLDRVGAPFNGDGYYVTRLRHTYDLASGHRTHFEAERATLNEASS